MRLAGATLATGAGPGATVPESDTVSGVVAELFGMLSVPVKVPATAVAAGVKVTLIEQAPPAATSTVQVFAEMAKLPVMAGMPTVSGPVPVFDTVTDCGALVVPAGWLA